MSTMGESRNGEIIINLNSKNTKRVELEEELRNNFGTCAVVRSLVMFKDVEIQINS